MKVKVINAFRDAETKTEYSIGSTIDLSSARVKEIQAFEVRENMQLIEVVPVKKTKTTTKKDAE